MKDIRDIINIEKDEERLPIPIKVYLDVYELYTTHFARFGEVDRVYTYYALYLATHKGEDIIKNISFEEVLKLVIVGCKDSCTDTEEKLRSMVEYNLYILQRLGLIQLSEKIEQIETKKFDIKININKRLFEEGVIYLNKKEIKQFYTLKKEIALSFLNYKRLSKSKGNLEVKITEITEVQEPNKIRKKIKTLYNFTKE